MNESTDLLCWLERWYQDQCGGEWEQTHGVTIQTLDNPGWLVKADLGRMKPKALATDRVIAVLGEPPSAKNGNIGGDIWMECKIKSGQFIGAGDPTQLQTILAQFRSLFEEGE